jgi:hypothetical protein
MINLKDLIRSIGFLLFSIIFFVSGWAYANKEGMVLGSVTLIGDSDGDGLLDDWEINGYDHDGDGIIDIDLPAMGANPIRKDIFVEVDWMKKIGDHNHKPKAKAIANVINAFANSPVSNPDGSTGITLHVDTGNLGGGNELPHDDDLNPVWTEFDVIKASNFAPERQPIFHYTVFAHQYNGGCSSGLSRGIPASDFIVSLGCWPDQVGTKIEQAGTFMHELGHNLALRHGGKDHENYKPNFLSVMNYFFQLRGLYVKGKWGKLDYSRFLINDLNENHLNEKSGLDAVGGDYLIRRYGTRAFCPLGNVQDIVKAKRYVDWDCDGNNAELDVAVDVNRSFSFSILTGMINEWDNIVYDGGLIGPDIGKELPTDFIMDELTYEEKMKIDPYPLLEEEIIDE